MRRGGGENAAWHANAVGEHHLDVVGAVDDVVVGENHAARVDDEAGATHGLRVALTLGGRGVGGVHRRGGRAVGDERGYVDHGGQQAANQLGLAGRHHLHLLRAGRPWHQDRHARGEGDARQGD